MTFVVKLSSLFLLLYIVKHTVDNFTIGVALSMAVYVQFVSLYACAIQKIAFDNEMCIKRGLWLSDDRYRDQ